MKFSIAVLLLVFMGFGCASPPAPPPSSEPPPTVVYSPPEPADEHGVTLSAFEDALPSVWRGEYSDDVASTLGLPDSTKSGSYDGRTDRPWFGETWVYSFRTSERRGRRCELTFNQEADGYLTLSTWNWYDY